MQVYWDLLLGATPVNAEETRTEQRVTLVGSLGDKFNPAGLY